MAAYRIRGRRTRPAPDALGPDAEATLTRRAEWVHARWDVDLHPDLRHPGGRLWQGSALPRATYRDKVEIVAAARAVVASDGYEDLDVRIAEPVLSVEVIRHGELPSTGRYESLGERDAALLWDLSALINRGARPSESRCCAPRTPWPRPMPAP